MANSNRKKASKVQAAKKAKAAEKENTVKKVKPAEEKPIKYTVTAEQQADGTFEFHGGKGGFNIIKQKNKALEPYGKCIHNYGGSLYERICKNIRSFRTLVLPRHPCRNLFWAQLFFGSDACSAVRADSE